MEYRHYELPAGFPIVALTGEAWRISHVPSKRLHIHNCLEIGLCHAQEGTLVLGNQSVAFHAGDVTCIASGVAHTTYSAPGCASLWSYLFLDPQTLLSALPWEHSIRLRQMLCSCQMVLSPAREPQAAGLVSAILSEMEARRPYYQWNVRGLCLALMTCLLRAGGGTERLVEPSPVLMPALDYIRANYMRKFPQDLLAEACHLSPTHFRRLFHEQMGVPPLTFLHQTRILESCTLMRTTGMSIAEAADRVGYASLSSFNRYFLRIMGCTPTEWRKSAGLRQGARVMTRVGWTSAERTPGAQG